VLPSEDQKELSSFQALWSKATKEERQLMQEIVARRAK
jgi:hypothetical protein